MYYFFVKFGQNLTKNPSNLTKKKAKKKFACGGPRRRVEKRFRLRRAEYKGRKKKI